RVTVLAANASSELVAQAREFSPEMVILADERAAAAAARDLGTSFRVEAGPASLVQAAGSSSVDIVVAGITGFACHAPVLRALETGKGVALANKECLVAAGHLLMRYGERIVPVDSEHSSIYQYLGISPDPVRRITLTASDGPFLRLPLPELPFVSPEDAVK